MKGTIVVTIKMFIELLVKFNNIDKTAIMQACNVFLCLEIQDPVGDCQEIATKLVLTLLFIDGLLIMDKILEKGAKEVNTH